MANLQRMSSKRLGEILAHSGLITGEQLEEALVDQSKIHRPLGEILVDRGYVTERDVAEVIATQFGLPYLSPSQYYTSTDASKLLPVETLKKHRLVPIDKLGEVLVLVIAGPVDNEVLAEIERQTGCTLEVYVGTTTDVNEAIEKIVEAQARDVSEP